MKTIFAAVVFLAVPIAAAQEVEKPTTVNGDSLGEIEKFQTRGPGRVCLENTAFDLIESETATLQYAGIHSASFVVTSPDGNLLIKHGNAWAPRQERMTTVWKRDLQSIRRAGRGSGLIYFYYAPSEYSDGQPIVTLLVSGKILKGDSSDIPRLMRLTLHADVPPDCLRRYTYGWDMLFGDEPLSTDKK